MEATDLINNYIRFLRRLNYSAHTIRNYHKALRRFVEWLDVPMHAVNNEKILQYIDFLLDERLAPKTINGYLSAIRGFYDYLIYEERKEVTNPVKPEYIMNLPRPLPRTLKDEEVRILFETIKKPRDQAMFRVMLRCGLRLEEVANLSLRALDFGQKKIVVYNGKFGKDRIVYMSSDVYQALRSYLRVRPSRRAKKLFLVEKGPYTGKPISVRGIQKRIEYYARKTGLEVSCHRLRHTMATQLLNADANMVTIQELLGHSCVASSQRYCKVSNLKVRRDYFKAMEVVMQAAKQPISGLAK
jgi:site-specific recombinase XerD